MKIKILNLPYRNILLKGIIICTSANSSAFINVFLDVIKETFEDSKLKYSYYNLNCAISNKQEISKITKPENEILFLKIKNLSVATIVVLNVRALHLYSHVVFAMNLQIKRI